MHAHHLMTFIKGLRDCGEFTDYDIAFLRRLNVFLDIPPTVPSTASEDDFIPFLQRIEDALRVAPDALLSVAQTNLLLSILADRWLKIQDTSLDPLIRSSKITDHWIALAHVLATDTNTLYLHLLMPSVTNTIDPNVFKKITDHDSPRDFILADDGVTLIGLAGLFDLARKSNDFFTYDHYQKHKKYSPRALTLKELLRLRTKIGTTSLDPLTEPSTDVWNHFFHEILPTRQSRGEVPKQLLPGLLELIELYFKEGENTPSLFSKGFVSWAKLLQDCSRDDLYCLYGQSLPLEDRSCYLLDVLLNCLQGNYQNLQPQIIALANWMFTQDESFIITIPPLEALYATLGVGLSFDLIQLKQCLNNLITPETTKTQTTLRAIIDGLSDQSIITVQLQERLKQLFQIHWLELLSKRKDYSSLQTDSKIHWIRLAQRLVYFDPPLKNYYRILMPTLRQDIDPVTRMPHHHYPLSHYIVSYDATALIYLGNCELHLKTSGTFNNCNYSPARPLHETELKRLLFANKRFQKYIPLARSGGLVEDKPLFRETVLAVHRLINASLFKEGLLFAHKYNKEQDTSAEKAYDQFFEFLEKLPDDERQRLFNQRILFQGRNVSFKQVLADTQSDRCIALCAQYFAQMVIDYAPYLPFSSDLEPSVYPMRQQSRKKIYRDYSDIDHHEAKRRLQLLVVSLLTHSFQYGWMGNSVSFWDCTNKMVLETEGIYLLIKPFIESTNFEDARSVYAQIIESKVIPALAVSPFLRYTDTDRWLLKIAKQSFFKERSWFTLEQFLTLSEDPLLTLDRSAAGPWDAFVTSLLQTIFQEKTKGWKELRVNIQFAKLLKNVDSTTRHQLLILLSEPPTHTYNNNEFLNLYAQGLIGQLAHFLVPPKNQTLFFSASGDRVLPRRIKKEAQDLFLMGFITSEGTIESLFQALERNIESVRDIPTRQRIRRYIDQIKTPIPVITNPRTRFTTACVKGLEVKVSK